MSWLALLAALVATCGSLASMAAVVQWLALGALERAPSSLHSRTWVRAGWVLLPVILGLVGLAVLVVPASAFDCHCALHGAHHPHFCVHHPAFAVPLVAPALVAVGAWGAVVAPRLWRVSRELVRGERWARALRGERVEWMDGVAIRLVQDVTLGAFTVGVLDPVIVVDRALWRRLGTDDRRAIVHHERAHAERRDGLTLAVLRAASALTIWPVSSRLVRAWKSATETACDRHAASVVGDPASVAQALVSVERIRAGLRGGGDRATALGVAAGSDLERRVLALLDHGDDGRPASALANDIVAVGIIVVGVGALVIAWPGDSFHHAVETAIGWVVP